MAEGILTLDPCKINRNGWAVVQGATPDEQWPNEFVPLRTGLQASIDDSQAVTISAVGSLYTFRQKNSIYGYKQSLSFQVAVNTRDGSLARLVAFLSDRGTASPIKGVFPGTGTTAKKWVQSAKPQWSFSGGQSYVVSVSLIETKTPG